MPHTAFAVDDKGYVSNQTCHIFICQLREAIEIKQMPNLSAEAHISTIKYRFTCNEDKLTTKLFVWSVI